MPSSFRSHSNSGKKQQLSTPRRLFMSEQQPDQQRRQQQQPVTPRRLFTPQKQPEFSPQQQLFTPQQQLFSPQQQLFTPQQQPSQHQQMFTPQKQQDQQQQMFTPQQQSSQQQQVFSPLQQPSQQQQMFSPQQQLFAPQQQLFTPQQQQLFTPQQQQLFTPQQQQLFTPQQQQLFTPQQPSPFQQTSSFSQLTAQQQQNLQVQQFQQQQQQRLPLQQYQQPQQQHLQLQEFQEQQQQQLQQFQEQPQHQLHLFTNDGAPASYSTKLADLHPDSQNLLLQIEEKIMEHRDESQMLDRCSRLYDSSVSNYGFASLIVQELGRISTTMKRQKAVKQELIAVAENMLLNTGVAVHSFLMLRPRFLHPKSSVAASIQASGRTYVMGTGQPMITATEPVFDFYSGVPRKPSQFLEETVARFDKYLGEYHRQIEELEQLLLVETDKNGINSSSSLLQALPKVMSNGHDLFLHVAAKVESIHQYIESRRTAYLADNRRQGLYNDPFLEADRRETAKEEVAAKRVHPTLHLPAISQPSTQVSGLTSTVPTNPHTIASATSDSKSSLFDTPSAVTSSYPPFSTPATAASSSLFGGFITPVQTLPGVSTPTLSSASLFGSTLSAAVSSFSNPFDAFDPGSTTTGSESSRGKKTSRKPRTKSSRRG